MPIVTIRLPNFRIADIFAVSRQNVQTIMQRADIHSVPTLKILIKHFMCYSMRV